MARAVYIRLLFFTGLLRWARYRVAKRGTVVLTLHRVLPDAEYDSAGSQRGMVVRARTFERLLQYLRRRCRCVLLDSAGPGVVEQGGGSRPRVALTFDDGWRDNFETAFPISRSYQLPFTVFLCPQMISGNGSAWLATVTALWWAARRAGKLTLVRSLSGSFVNGSVDSLIERLKQISPEDREAFIAELKSALEPYTADAPASPEHLLSWSQVKEMGGAGVSFGSHTNTHQVLTRIARSDAIKELAESRKAIEAELNTCPWLAYPHGDWSESVRDLVSQTGYRHAFTNSPGVWGPKTNPLSIPRINIWEGSLTGAGGRFSKIATEYAIFWKAYRASLD